MKLEGRSVGEVTGRQVSEQAASEQAASKQPLEATSGLQGIRVENATLRSQDWAGRGGQRFQQLFIKKRALPTLLIS